MGKVFYPKLALQNISKNARNYISYIITCVITIAMFYIMAALTVASELDQFYGLSQARLFLSMGRWVIGVFAIIFLFYTHSFIIKRRKKEFGLYNILGMEKRHIAIILFYETLYCALISLGLGIFFGIVLYRAAQLFLLKLIHTQVELGSTFSLSGLTATLILFGIIFLLTFLSTLRQIQVASPVELLRGGQVGEKEPKARWFLVLLGIACLGGGYYISITATSPMETVGLFLIAVIMVIVGTYCLFTSVTIAVLKLMRKNKKYYYKPNHFTFISGMLYRMKQNAVGLANICVLSTMVLVMVSTCLMLYVGIGDTVHSAYPRDIQIEVRRPDTDTLPDIRQQIETVLEENAIVPENVQYFYASALTLMREDNCFYYNTQSSVYTDTNTAIVTLMTLEDFNRLSNTSYTLEDPSQVYIYDYNIHINDSTIILEDTPLTVKDTVDGVAIADGSTKDMVSSFYLIVKDMDTLLNLRGTIEEKSMYSGVPSYNYSFDVEGDSDREQEVMDILVDQLYKGDQFFTGSEGSISSTSQALGSLYELYGGLLFIGCFLGILFLMAMVLIIYYKQITEGYEDQHRFEIMQNVGMSRREVRGTIKSQVLSVFYLPLGLACVHTAFAFPIVSRLLALMQMTNTTLFLGGMIGTMAVFALFYTIIYILTAQVYYKIVS